MDHSNPRAIDINSPAVEAWVKETGQKVVRLIEADARQSPKYREKQVSREWISQLHAVDTHDTPRLERMVRGFLQEYLWQYQNNINGITTFEKFEAANKGQENLNERFTQGGKSSHFHAQACLKALVDTGIVNDEMGQKAKASFILGRVIECTLKGFRNNIRTLDPTFDLNFKPGVRNDFDAMWNAVMRGQAQRGV